MRCCGWTVSEKPGGAALAAALREVTTELLAALLPPRRNRQCQRIKKPSKNTFEVRKRDQPRTPSNVRYTLKVTKHPT